MSFSSLTRSSYDTVPFVERTESMKSFQGMNGEETIARLIGGLIRLLLDVLYVLDAQIDVAGNQHKHQNI